VAAREPVDANGEPALGNQVVAAKWGDEFMDMLATTPTTPGGAIALIDCFLEHEEENFDGVFGPRLLALRARLRGFLQSAA
jgi:hypothetical protein